MIIDFGVMLFIGLHIFIYVGRNITLTFEHVCVQVCTNTYVRSGAPCDKL